MTTVSEQELAFANFLQGLVDSENLAALAALRRGLGEPPGEAAVMYPYVVPWIPSDARPWQEAPYYLVASLFALHQGTWDDEQLGPHNLGASFARLRQAVEGDSVEKRFVALLNCHREDLPDHLRHAVSLLSSKGIPVDWAVLLHDLKNWDRQGRPVQRAWARAFWREPVTQPGDTSARAGS